MKFASHLRAALTGAAMLVAASVGAAAGPKDNIALIGMTSEPVTLDPGTGFTGFDYPYLYSIYDRLIDFDPVTLEPRPGLATKWGFVGDDKKIFELKIRQGVKFQDGTDLNAEAVKASLLHFKKVTSRDDIKMVKSIEVIDPYTVRLHLDREYSVLPAVLADRAGMIVSPAAVEKYGEEYPRHPVGTGPFKLKNWTAGSALELETFEEYWNRDRVKLSGITFRIVTNQTALVSAVLAGQIDHAFSLDPTNLAVLRAKPGLRVRAEPTLFYYQLMLNTEKEPLNDVRVRQALNMSVDRQALVDAVLGKDVSEGPALMPVPPSTWAYSQSLKDAVTYDPQKAKQLLAEAGYPDGVTLKICGTPTILGYDNDIVAIEREQMKPAGFNLEATMLAGSACQQAWSKSTEYHARQGGFTGRPDPLLTYQNNFASNGTNNRGKIAFPGVDAIMDRILAAYTREEQKAIYDELNAAWIENVPHVLLFYGANVAVYANGLAGEEPNAQGKLNPISFYFDQQVGQGN